MKCPVCPRAELVHDIRDIPCTYKGESTVIPSSTGDFRPACGRAVLKKSESVRISALMLEFNKQANASIVDPAFIASVRKKLALDQRETGEIFGGCFIMSSSNKMCFALFAGGPVHRCFEEP